MRRTIAELLRKHAAEEPPKKSSGDGEIKKLSRIAKTAPFRDVMIRDLTVEHV
jgi:hypothetical protein